MPPEPNFTKYGYEGSPDIVVIPIVLVFPEFLLHSTQQPSEAGGVRIFTKNGRFGTPIFWGSNFHGIPLLMNNTAKTSFAEDLEKIHIVIA